MQHDLATMRRAAMLEQIDPLPSAKDQSPRGHGNGKLRLRKRGPDTRRHVVQTFATMDVALVVSLRKNFEIRLDIGVGIPLNEKRRGGMAAENSE